MQNQDLEQTLVLIKPDALKNSLSGYIMSHLSEFHTKLKFAGAKIVRVSKMLAQEHYEEHKDKAFFPSLIEYITGRSHYPRDAWKRRVIALVYQGKNAVRTIREIAGPTNPLVAREQCPGCIRSLGAIVNVLDDNDSVIGDRIDNLIHASASDDEAEREIKLWFTPDDIPPLMHAFAVEEVDAHYYFVGGTLSLEYEPGSACLMAPGEMAWKSDLDTLRALTGGAPAPGLLNSVAAKYLTHRERFSD